MDQTIEDFKGLNFVYWCTGNLPKMELGAGEIPAADHGSSAVIVGARSSLAPAVATLP